MTKYQLIILGLTIIGYASVSCSREESGLVNVSVDVDEAEVITVDPAGMVQLETNDSSLLYNINTLEKIGDRLIISSTNMVKTYSTDGRYLGNISGKGKGPEEFVSLSQMWTKDGFVMLRDGDTKRILTFSPDGQFENAQRLPDTRDPSHSTSYFIEHPKTGEYFVINCFTDGTTETNPALSVYDHQWNLITDIPGRTLLTGGYTSDRMAIDEPSGTVYYWEALKDTLFEVRKDGVVPVYAFDFGKYTLPDNIQSEPEMFIRMRAFSRTEAPVEYVSLIRCYQRYGDQMFFVVSSTSDKNYLCRLNLETGDVKVFEMKPESDRYQMNSFLRIIGNDLYLSFSDTSSTEANPILYIVSVNEFLEK
ncbi:MAG: 6-bladed beta-propeller [Clostridium sp.]|nr:6-bladed beta-propeller [Clostridium sp.]